MITNPYPVGSARYQAWERLITLRTVNVCNADDARFLERVIDDVALVFDERYDSTMRSDKKELVQSTLQDAWGDIDALLHRAEEALGGAIAVLAPQTTAVRVMEDVLKAVKEKLGDE